MDEAIPDFDIIETGIEGRVQAVPCRDLDHDQKLPFKFPRSTLPFGLPPVLKSVEENIEELLTSPEQLPLHDTFKYQRFLPRERKPERLYALNVTPVQTTIVVSRNPTTGQLIGFAEEFVHGTGCTAKNSTSLKRPPGPPEENVRGSSTNLPFWPGGLDELDLDILGSKTPDQQIDLEKDLLQIPPGFSHGVSTFENKSLSGILDLGSRPMTLDLADLLADDDFIDFGDDPDKETAEQPKDSRKITSTDIDPAQKDELDDIIKLDDRIHLPSDDDVLPSVPGREEYAIKLDANSPVNDFNKKVPDMACKWQFELDVFQKLAILKLENHDSVFVAAHTSAGKTVVAEYAIALSMKHMTRTVYTSPIKALSNQKFRDFKTTFKDVGLITGDVQINPQASCLIMTTEILRSMLYSGSDVIRDLEWVIFDEVHYINDAERGVVWEEVLIMLPDHVSIILLSATVPNSMEFADWVGRTKKKHMYVVSTQKRPVPLEHYLYTGNSGKSSDELFLLVDDKKNFLTKGYNKAQDAKKERPVKANQAYGAKGQKSITTASQDKNVWLSVIAMLRKKDKLPVVAFTFSKKRIEDNARHLSSVDLLNAREKSEVHIFFQKSISKLKGSDRKLPQVLHIQDLLKRGVGVHHSGVLPILKEVVEMLFGKGLVKILFATETFAMGVNMPARTVVFDTIRKHDGTNFRDLMPGEYIQMAGRAGRRGIDTTGTVIILCKADVPLMADLHQMMLGRPTQLTSQFRLTYTMILNLLRVEQLRVEDMMKRSFSEFGDQKNQAKHKDTLESLLGKIRDMPEVVDYSGDLETYYRACEEYMHLEMKLKAVMISHPQAIKMLTPGRVVIINTSKHKYSLGLVLQSSSASSKERTFTVLTLCEQQSDKLNEMGKSSNSKRDNSAGKSSDDNDILTIQPFRAQYLYRPEGPSPGCEMVKIKSEDISVITTKTIKIVADRIIDDIKKRQQPRFRNDPPGQTTSLASQELLRLSEANPTGLPGIDAIKDLHIRDVDLVEEFRHLAFLEESLSNRYGCIHDPNFDQNFDQLRMNMKLRDEYNKVKYLLSDESLQLLPEYQQRIQVLQELQYIDSSSTVQLKGRVACEISSHELIITELVFDNLLTGLQPTEIAAMLSCVVFEQKRCSEPNLSPCLKTCQSNFLDVAAKIGLLQRQCGLPLTVDDYVEQFHFGLMEVVFEWARGMPFAEITELTDIQEGIIVRCIQRLDETLKDVRNAARIIGDPVLYQKMEEASKLIKRDIVFAASLYTQ